MTSLLDKPRTRGAGAGFVAGQPQVNLLPPEIRAARGLKRVQGYLALLLVVVLLACAGAYVVARLDKANAESGLTKAQDRTAELQADEAKYADVPRVLGQLDDTKKALDLGMSTEILWKPYYDAIAAVLPAGVSLDSLTVTEGTPMTAGPAAGSPLEEPSIGQVQFSARSKTLPDTAALVDALDAIPGLGDAWVTSAAVQADDTSKTVYYNVSATVQVRDTAYAHRFDQTAEAN